MKKNYFMKVFNTVELLIFSMIGMLLLTLICLGLRFFVENGALKNELQPLIRGLALLGTVGKNFIGVGLLLVLIFIWIEILINRGNDNRLFTLKSIPATLSFRHFLKYRQENALLLDNINVQAQNITQKNFNRAVHHSYLYLSEMKLILMIKVPKQAQAQKILKELEEQIKEEIAGCYPDYIISTFERKKHQIRLIGTKH